jgi:hypothetical protein
MDKVEPTTRFEVIFDAEGRNTAKFRNEIAVHKRFSHPVTVELPTDEGPAHGGEAPLPIHWPISQAG